MSVDLAALHNDVVRAVAAASAAPGAWNAILHAVVATGHAVPESIRARDIADDVEDIVTQLAQIRAEEPPPDDLSFLYFGLVDVADPDTNWQEVGTGVGFYVSGGQAENPERDLPDVPRSYFPEDRFLKSPLLQAIREASRTLGRDYNVFDYGLMLGAAGLLAKFAAARLGLTETILVGFDCSDYARVA